MYTQFVQDISKSLDATLKSIKQKLASTADRNSIRYELKLLLKAKLRAENEKMRYCNILEKLQDTKANAESLLRNVTLMESLKETSDVMNGVNVNAEEMDSTIDDIADFQKKVSDIDGVVESLAKSLEMVGVGGNSDETNQQLEDELEALVKGLDQMPTVAKSAPPIDKNGNGGSGIVEKVRQTPPVKLMSLKDE
jgi:hypothetical protein